MGRHRGASVGVGHLNAETRPIPVPDELSAPFWAATERGVLALAKCSACSHVVHPPIPVCPACQSTEPGYTYHPVNPRGVLRSWTVVRQSFLPGFADDLPMVLADVALDDVGDVRLIGRLLDGPDAEVRVGAAVAVAFEHLPDGSAVPAFTLEPPT